MAVRDWVRAVRGRAEAAGARPNPDFDPAFYRESNPDLAALADDRALERHYRLYGEKEGRAPSYGAGLAALIGRHGAPPAGFDPLEYLAANPDLRSALRTPLQAIEHYVRFGRHEHRTTFKLDPELYAELNGLDERLDDEALHEHFARVGRARGLIGTAAGLAKSKGLSGRGGWIEAIRPREFALVNAAWAGRVSTRLEAVDAMLAEGGARRAALSFDAAFDPAYARDAEPSRASQDDDALYRDWLFRGLDHDRPGTAAAHLTQLELSLQAYPEGFDWRAWATASGVAKGSRWSALDHYVRNGLATDAPPPLTTNEPDASAFLAALGRSGSDLPDSRRHVLLTRARELAPLDPAGLQALAEVCADLGREAEAFEAFAAAASTIDPEPSVFIKGARAAISAEDPEGALALLRQGRGRAAGAPLFREAVGEAIEAAFDRRLAALRPLYLDDRRAEADAAIVAAAEDGADLWRTLDPIGAPLETGGDGRVVVLANVDLPQCTHYRVAQKVELLAASGRAYAVYPASEQEAFLGALAGASAAIFYRLPGTPAILRAIDYARNLGLQTWYEIDDLIFTDDYPDAFESYGGSISREAYAGLLAGVPLFRLALSRCDRALASTTALAERMRPFVRTGEVAVLPNGLDHRNAPFLSRPPLVRRDDGVMLFYGSGTRAHNSDFLELAGPAIAALMDVHEDVRLTVVGHLELDERLGAYRDRITALPFVRDPRSYWSLLAEADVNLATLAPGPVADAKSEIKWLEAAVLGIPSVLSPTHRYREVVEDGVDALLAADPGQWHDALTRLVEDPGLRTSLGAAARAKALREYGIEAGAAQLDALLPEPSHRPGAEAGGRSRVLLVNTFFPPQTIGGATRVVRDNLADFFDLGAPYDFAVACTDHDAPEPYRTRVESHEGCPVFRMSVPGGVNMDWNARDPVAGDLFAEVLDAWRPDLVHFHAVQRLTGSAVEACARRGLPYLVTTHDAWWLSDHQFLVDDRDRLHDPCAAVPSRPPAPATVGDSLARRRYLGRLLAGARRVVGVSETFAALHRSCGVERVVAVPNGVPSFTPATRVPAPDGRVRVAHVGGMSAHKGYRLLEAALKAGRFANLVVTIVDHAGYGGAERLETWGATPVRIVGKTAGDAMAGFYAAQDVLAAPSTWPESYGLVAREALAAGLWVIAGDRGAMGEDVRPGVTGWVVDVSGPAALSAALAEIDGDPARYSTPPPPTPLRPARAQAEALLTLYAELLAEPAPAPMADIPVWAGESARDRFAPDDLAGVRRASMRYRWGRSATQGRPLE